MSTDLVAENIDLFSKVFRLEAELSSERARVESLQSDVERLTAERDELQRKVWEIDADEKVNRDFLNLETAARYRAEASIAAERRRVEELETALTAISSPAHTLNLLWWQALARQALANSRALAVKQEG